MEVRFDCRIEKTERCIRQLVLIVVKNAKFPSNQIQVDLSTVENVIVNEDRREGIVEDINLTSSYHKFNTPSFFLLTNNIYARVSIRY